ncbi:MAG: fasciclin domain-containing protein, partial [Myxococcota bacterium]
DQGIETIQRVGGEGGRDVLQGRRRREDNGIDDVDDAVAGQDPNLANILLGHVVAGQTLAESLSDGQTITTEAGTDITITIDGDGNVFINTDTQVVQVIETDILASNGVIHVIDTVILAPPPPLGTIPEVLAADPGQRFGTLLQALELAGLTDLISGDGPFTAFAPTDAAFTALGADLNALQEQGLLALILSDHVLSGITRSGDLPARLVVDTLSGLPITITVTDEGETHGCAAKQEV